MRYLLHDVFTSSTKKNPTAIAVRTEDGRTITYQNLNSLSNCFAHSFKELKPDLRTHPFVGIISSVHIESIAAVLGALKIGCAYVPLDEYSPTERLAMIVENTKLDIICIDPHLYEQHKELFKISLIKHVILLGKSIEPLEEKVIPLESVLNNSDSEPEALNQVSDDLAYILHSSGSTGVPKGIMLTHRNARTFVDWMQKEFKLTHGDIVASRAPFKFDLSVFDIFNTFNAGACLACFDWNKERETDKKHADYVSMLEKESVTILYTTPSTFISLLNRGDLARKSVPLRTIMYAGEPFPPAQLRRLMQALPKTQVANIYGPTETNIITYYWIKEPPTDDKPIPLGAVVEDTNIIVVSEDGKKICASGELGELWCRGGTVTLGYLGMPEKTKESLVQSPFHPYPAYFWRTGDYGFYDENQVLHYRGRRDHMVKVKGYRVELGEIENALAQHPSIDEFVVVAVPDEKYGNRLYCHFSPLQDKALSIEELKLFLLQKIPEYMIPYQFKSWSVLPKTSSGKIDRVKLAEESYFL